MNATSQHPPVLELVARVRENDAAACEDLCRFLYPSMEKWLFGMINERHPDVKVELVAEVLQEAWLTFQRKIGQFRGTSEAQLMGWCYRVTFATCKNYLKKYVRTRHREEATETPPEPPERPRDNPRQELIRDEKLEQVRDAVRAIKNEKHREAIVLFFFEELSQKDIAEMMGATESAVSTWVYRGKAEIERYLHERGFQL